MTKYNPQYKTIEITNACIKLCPSLAYCNAKATVIIANDEYDTIMTGINDYLFCQQEECIL